jgi:hypothetical protein
MAGESITTTGVAKVMVRLFILPMLRNEISKVYTGQKYNALDRYAVKRVVIEKMDASPAGAVIRNYLKAAGLTYDDVIYRV